MDYEHLLNIGSQHELISDLHEAARCFNAATQVRPSSAKGWILFSEVLMKIGQAAKASDVLSRAMNRFPRRPNDNKAEGISDLESALSRALEVQGRDIEAQVVLRLVYSSVRGQATASIALRFGAAEAAYFARPSAAWNRSSPADCCEGRISSPCLVRCLRCACATSARLRRRKRCTPRRFSCDRAAGGPAPRGGGRAIVCNGVVQRRLL